MRELPLMEPGHENRYESFESVVERWCAVLAGAELALEWAAAQLERLTPRDEKPWELYSLAEAARKTHAEANCAAMCTPQGLVVDTFTGFEFAWDPDRVRDDD